MAAGKDYATEQLKWYEGAVKLNRRFSVSITVLKLALAAIIPVLTLIPIDMLSKVLTASFGAAIVFLEGLNQYGQYRQNWARNAITAENLKAEIVLAETKAGPYARAASNPDGLLAMRASRVVRTETETWWAQGENAKDASQGDGDKSST